MKLCTTCHRSYSDDDTRCSEHGETLQPDAILGATLGSFHVDGWLGEGGMGVLYRAEHTTIHRKAAVKVLKREFITDASIAGRFAQEARAVSKIGHPHLIDIFDIGTTPDGRLYYVMELLDGRALAEAMERGRLTFPIFGPILVQACEALEAAHAVGIVHRDLKPDNLFLVERAGEPPFVKVLDFGVAKVLGTDEDVQGKLTRTGNIVGTPQYMAPEQIDGSAIDHRADVYALGVILYELATGSLPFRAETLGQMLKAHLVAQVPPFEVGKLADGVPPVLESVAMRALAKLPEERYPTVRALREDLGRVLDGKDPEAVGWRARQLEGGATVVDSQLPAHLQAELRANQTIDLKKPQPTLATAPKRPSWTLPVLGLLGAGAVAAFVIWPKPKPSDRVATAAVDAGPSVAQAPKRKGPDLPALRSKALGVLQAALKDGDPSVRKSAVETLAQAHDARHRTLIEPLLDDADTQVRAAAASALGGLGARAEAAPLTAALGKDKNVDVWIAEALDQLGDPAGHKRLLDVLKHGDDAGKLKAGLALAESSDGAAKKEAARSLAKRAAKASPVEKSAILFRLARGGDGKARAALKDLLEKADAASRLPIAEALARLGDESGRAELARVGADTAGDGHVRLLALRVLSSLDDQSGYDLFRGTFVDSMKPEGDRAIAAQGLGASGEKAALESLAPGLDEGEPSLRIAAAGAVLAIAGADPRALAARSADWATAALTDGSWTVRESAAAVLGDLEPKLALPLLGQAIKDSQPEVRRAAAKSLGRTRVAAAVPLLGQVLADGERKVRVVALRSMGQVGKDSGDQGAQKLLSAHLAQASPEEKVVAAAALVNLGDKSHVDELKQGLASADPEIRKLAVEESAVDPALSKDASASALKDRSFEVRFAAASSLAAAGSKDGAEVLQEAVKRGGNDGLAAYAALKKLGVEPQAEIDPLKLLDAADPELRRAAVEAGARLPSERAIVFLQRALHDPDPRVRTAAVEVAASLGAPGLALLKGAASDGDAGVRARAGALVARLAPPPASEDEAPAATKPAVASPTGAPDGGAQLAVALPDAAPSVAIALVPDAAVALAVAPSAPDAGVAPLVDDKGGTAKDESTQEEARLAMSTGDVFLAAGKYDQAIHALARAHKLDGKLPVYFALGEAYRRLGDREADKQKQHDDYSKAINWYRRAREPKAKSYAAELADRLKE